MAYEIVPCLYNTEKDLQARIHGTICRYENVPYFVHVESAKKINLYDLKKFQLVGDEKPILSVSPTDPLFDISSPEIGYMNFDFELEFEAKVLKKYTYDNISGNMVLYFQRSPTKQWKQGLNYDSTKSYRIDGGHITLPTNWLYIFYSEGTRNMLKGEYPTVPVAVYRLLRMSTEKYKTIAVSKDVALQKTDSDIIQVYVKRDNVGYILPGERTIHVKKDKNSWITRKYLEGLRASVV